MAQTTGSISWANCLIEISINDSAWTDISGMTNAVKVDGGERAMAEFFTATGDIPILTKGKRSSLEVTGSAVYTELAEIAEIIRVAYEAGNILYFRWSPKGGAGGTFSYKCNGVPTKPVYPQGAADSADAIPCEFTIKTKEIVKSTL